MSAGEAEVGSMDEGGCDEIEDYIEPLTGNDGGDQWQAQCAAWTVHLKGEDAYKVERAEIGGERFLLSLVADGHGGRDASQYCAEKVLRYVIDLTRNNPDVSAVKEALQAAFLRAHKEICELPGPEPGIPCTAGSTLTVCVVNEDRREVVVANVGDSACILFHPGENRHTMMSEDHRLANNAEERQRVLAVGSNLGQALDSTGRPCGPVRVWPGGVCMARSIGDSDAGGAIDPNPAIQSATIPAHGGSLVLCSDGVWDCITMSAVRRIARGSATPDKSVHAVVRKAVTAHQAYASSDYGKPRDDTTCVVVNILPPTDPVGGGTKPKSKLTKMFGRRSSGTLEKRTTETPKNCQQNGHSKRPPTSKTASCASMLKDASQEGTVTKASGKFGRANYVNHHGSASSGIHKNRSRSPSPARHASPSRAHQASGGRPRSPLPHSKAQAARARG